MEFIPGVLLAVLVMAYALGVSFLLMYPAMELRIRMPRKPKPLLDPRLEFSLTGLKDSLASTDCPTCKLDKREGRPLCMSCFVKLHHPLRRALQDAINNYHAAVGPREEADTLAIYGDVLATCIRRLTDGDCVDYVEES